MATDFINCDKLIEVTDNRLIHSLFIDNDLQNYDNNLILAKLIYAFTSVCAGYYKKNSQNVAKNICIFVLHISKKRLTFANGNNNYSSLMLTRKYGL